VLGEKEACILFVYVTTYVDKLHSVSTLRMNWVVSLVGMILCYKSVTYPPAVSQRWNK